MPLVFLLALPLLAPGCGQEPEPGWQGEAAIVTGDWLDRVVPPDRRLIFAGPKANMALQRADGIVRFQVSPALWPLPRVVFTADAADGDTVLTQPDWSDIAKESGWGRPYHVRIVYPVNPPWDPAPPSASASPARPPASHSMAELAGVPTTEPDAARPQSRPGRAEYYMLDRAADDPHAFDFSADLVAWTSPMHLVLTTLAPLPIGQVRIRAATRHGVTYWATIDVAADSRELRFPRALLWGDWSDEQLAIICRFKVSNFPEWPESQLEFENISPLDPLSAEFKHIEPLR